MSKHHIVFPALLVIMFMTCLLFHLSKVESVSMEPTLLPGDIVLHSRVLDIPEIKINDIIIFRSLEDDSTLLIKRVSGIIRLNENNFMFDVRGDNRDNSCDSRHFGYVSAEKVDGKVFMILASWNCSNKSFRTKRFFKRV